MKLVEARQQNLAQGPEARARLLLDKIFLGNAVEQLKRCLEVLNLKLVFQEMYLFMVHLNNNRTSYVWISRLSLDVSLFSCFKVRTQPIGGSSADVGLFSLVACTGLHGDTLDSFFTDYKPIRDAELCSVVLLDTMEA